MTQHANMQALRKRAVAGHAHVGTARNIVLPAHDTVLATASAYFRARLLRWPDASGGTMRSRSAAPGPGARPTGGKRGVKGGGSRANGGDNSGAANDSAQPTLSSGAAAERAPSPNGDAPPPAPRELLEPVTRQELYAARDVVQFMYTNLLPKATEPLHLLQMYIVADRWDAPDCVEACLEGLLYTPPELFTVPLVNALTGEQPHSVAQHPLFPRLQNACAARLRGLFSPAHAVVADGARLTSMCGLSLQSLLLWLGDSGVHTDSENTMAVLVTYWWHANGGGALAAAAGLQVDLGAELSRRLRLRHLSTSFLLGVLPSLPWFTAPRGLMDLFRLVCLYPRAGDRARPSERLLQQFPPAWMGPMRLPADMSRARVDWALGRGELEGALGSAPGTLLIAPAHDIPGPALYWGGFVWQLVLQFTEPPGQHGIEGGLGFRLLSALDPDSLAVVWQRNRPSSAGSGGGTGAGGTAAGHGIGSSMAVFAPRAAQSPTGTLRAQAPEWHATSNPTPAGSYATTTLSAAGGAGAAGVGDAFGLGSSALAGGQSAGGQSSFGTQNGGGGGFTIALPPAISAKVTVSCKEAATGNYTHTFTLDAMAGMLAGDTMTRANFFAATLMSVDDLAPFMVADHLHMTLQLEAYT